MSANFARGHGEEVKCPSPVGLAFHPKEDPVIGTFGLKISLVDPSAGLIGMASPELSPDGVKNGMIDRGEDFLGDASAVEIGPPLEFSVENRNHLMSFLVAKRPNTSLKAAKKA